MISYQAELKEHLDFLYGKDQASSILPRIINMLKNYKKASLPDGKGEIGEKVNEQDVVLITYGDMVQKPGELPLKTLGKFLRQRLEGVVSSVHILPFYPYSSDDGFSVIDYRQVNPALGDWEDIAQLNQDFKLMFDAVINHCSVQSEMFQGFLSGKEKYQNYFTVIEPDTDLSRVFRPRAFPVLTPFNTHEGEKLVWTTFSTDQADLNFKEPEVLLEVVDILLFYVSQGAELIRFDAVTFVWKEIGTSCANLPGTHRFVQLMRTILKIVAPNVVLITETNVPHEENIGYFGDGTNEADMVYNFALPILVLHTFITQNVTILSDWAKTLGTPTDQTAFFNFLAGHDGIGILPARDLLSKKDLDAVIKRVQANGGLISFKNNEDGSKSPYELNINFFDALNDPEGVGEINLDVSRFLASQAIMLALRGVPGIYFHSLFGSRNWEEGVKETGRNRSINREKLQLEKLGLELDDPSSMRAKVFNGFVEMLKIRRVLSAFHPFGVQEVLDVDPRIFAVMRVSPDQTERVLCLNSVSNERVELTIDLEVFGFGSGVKFQNMFTREIISKQNGSTILVIPPFSVVWLTAL
jgi:sucrose phosphorylase